MLRSRVKRLAIFRSPLEYLIVVTDDLVPDILYCAHVRRWLSLSREFIEGAKYLPMIAFRIRYLNFVTNSFQVLSPISLHRSLYCSRQLFVSMCLRCVPLLIKSTAVFRSRPRAFLVGASESADSLYLRQFGILISNHARPVWGLCVDLGSRK